METIHILDRQFTLSITEQKIQQTVTRLSQQLNHDFRGREVTFLVILNGAFMFAADLIRQISLPCSLSFVKLSSYRGSGSTGTVDELIGLNEHLEGRHVVVLEDIIDTGRTLVKIMELVGSAHPSSASVVSLLLKPEACREPVRIDYTGLEIPDDFVIGYGLDYNGYGRNLPFICALTGT